MSLLLLKLTVCSKVQPQKPAIPLNHPRWLTQILKLKGSTGRKLPVGFQRQFWIECLSLPVLQGRKFDKSAAQFIADKVRSDPGNVSVLALGPLTNIAMAFQISPEVARDIVSSLALPNARKLIMCKRQPFTSEGSKKKMACS